MFMLSFIYNQLNYMYLRESVGMAEPLVLLKTHWKIHIGDVCGAPRMGPLNMMSSVWRAPPGAS